MREERALRPDDENAEPMGSVDGREPSRGASDSDASETGDVAGDLRADAPAELSVHSHPADIEEAALSDEEIDTYRRRVADGSYNSRDVAADVARRMMKSGDI